MADDIKSLEQKAEQSNIIDDDEFSFAENGQQYNQAKISRGAIVIATSTVLILAIGIVVSVILAPSLMLVNMKEQISNDLNDAAGAYYVFTHKVLGSQLGGNCDEESIKCKFKTMSNMLKERFENYGVKVDARENSQGRFTSARLTLPSKDVVTNENQLLDISRRNNKDSYSIHNVITPSGGLYHDRKFSDRLYKRFHLEHRPTVYGYTPKDVGRSFGEALIKNADYIDANAQGVYGLHFLGNDKNKEIWKKDIVDRLMDQAKSTHLALACSMYTYADLADNAVRNARAVTLARFAMQYMALADAIKSGNSSNFEAAINILTDRLTVVNKAGKNAFDSSSYRIPASLEAADYNKLRSRNRDYMNDAREIISQLATGSIGSTAGTLSLRGSLYSTSVLAGIPSLDPYKMCAGGISSSAASNENKDEKTCAFPSAIAASSLVSPAVAAVYAMELYMRLKGYKNDPCPALESLVRDVNTKIRPSVSSFVPDKMASASRTDADYFSYLAAGVETTETAELGLGIATQDAVFSGAGIILGDAAQSIGMRPATKESLRKYHNYINYGSEVAGLVNKNKSEEDKTRKFVSSIARSIYGYSNTRTLAITPTQTIKSIFTLAPRSLESLSKTVNAAYSQPVNTAKERFLTMSDCSLESGNFINPDFGCNVRYSMSKKDMDISIDNMLNYMTRPHPEEAQKSLNEVNSRDMQGDSNIADRMRKEAAEGAKSSYIDPKTGKPNKYTEYAKFLEFCVNRKDPWGSIGLATEYQDEKYTPDAEDKTKNPVRRTYGGTYIEYMDSSDDPTKKREVPSAYYGRAWGSTVDQDWMSGRKCAEESNMLNNFRAYTASCRVLAGMSGAKECWHHDSNPTFNSGFYARNNILFTREN